MGDTSPRAAPAEPAGDAERCYQLYCARRTVLQMLRDRGFLVAAGDVEMTEETFKERFTDTPVREDLTILVQKQDNPTDQVCVFWPNDEKLGVKQVLKLVNRLGVDDVRRGIFVTQRPMTDYAKKALVEIQKARGIVLEHFQEGELRVNITEHTLVPLHEVLSEADKAALLRKYHTVETKLPRIQVSDPIARYYGLRPRQVVRIVRASETAGRYVTYRLCQ